MGLVHIQEVEWVYLIGQDVRDFLYWAHDLAAPVRLVMCCSCQLHHLHMQCPVNCGERWGSGDRVGMLPSVCKGGVKVCICKEKGEKKEKREGKSLWQVPVAVTSDPVELEGCRQWWVRVKLAVESDSWSVIDDIWSAEYEKHEFLIFPWFRVPHCLDSSQTTNAPRQ